MLNLIRLKTTKFQNLAKRYKLANGGVAAIEFVFVAPVMIFMYFGLAEISTAVAADRKISHGTNVGGDLETQVATITAGQMSEIMTATSLVIGVPTDELEDVKIEIASFERESNGDINKLGKASVNGTFPGGDFKAEDLGDLILSEGSGIVVARVSYEYQPLQLRFFDKPFTMSETFLLKPRKSATVEFDNGAGIVDYTCNFAGRAVNCS